MIVNEKMRKCFSILLCLCMLVQNFPVATLAATTDNLCRHHAEHTAECGYVEGEHRCHFECTQCTDSDAGKGGSPEGLTEKASEPSTEATEPSTEATEPSTEATEPSTEATEPSTEATEPSTEATEPSTEATEPSTEATEPSTEATEPSTEATEPSTETTESTPVCTCGTDDAAIHATTCPIYVRPENPQCFCVETCDVLNEWCDVCGFDITKCGGEDVAAAYDESTCNHQLNTNTEYTPDANGATHSLTCSICRVVINSDPHSGSKATCTEKAVCTVCGTAYGNVANHAMSYTADEDTNTITYQCATCDTQTVTFTLVIPTGMVYGSSQMAVPYYTCSDTAYTGECPVIELDDAPITPFVPEAKTYEVTMTWGDQTVIGEYTIAKADPVIGTVGCEMLLYNSTAVFNVDLTRTDTRVDGVLTLMDSELTAGVGTYHWAFTPVDTKNYNIITGTVTLNVIADVLEKIEASGTLTKTAYEHSDSLSIDGLTVTATYASGATKDVTANVTFDSTLAMGQTSVELTFDGKTCVVSGITVARKQLDLSHMAWNVPTDAVYRGTAYTATLSGDLPASVAATLSGNEATDAGSYTAKAVFSLKDGYSADHYEIVNGADLTADWSIAKKDITGAEITLGSALTYNGAAQTQTIASVKIDNLPVTYTVTGNTGTDIKDYTLTVTGNGNFTGTETAEWNIGKADASIIWNSGYVNSYGSNMYITSYINGVDGKMITGTAVATVYDAQDNALNSVTCTKTETSGTYFYNNLNELSDGTYLAPGTYTVRVTFQGNDHYLEKTVDLVNYTINKRTLTVTANDITITYGEEPSANGVVYAGFVVGETESVLSGELTYSYDYAQYSDVGTYAITPGGLTSENYEIAFVDGALTVNAKAITVTAEAKSKTYGDTDPALTYVLSENALINDDTMSGALTRKAGTDVGTYAITQGTLTAGGNYTITYTGADFTINKRNVTVSAKDQTISYGSTISDTEITTTGLVDGHSVTAALTPSTANVTADGTITASAAVITADGTDVTANYVVSYASGKLVIEPDTAKIDDLTTENVTSEAEEDIKAVQEMLDQAESVDDAWAAIDGKCENLLDRIEAVAAEQKVLAAEAAIYDAETVKSTEKDELDALAEKINDLLDTENLTKAERTALKAVQEEVEGMIETLEETAKNSKTATETIEVLDPETVTSADRGNLQQAIETIEALLNDTHLTEAQRKALEDAKQDAEALIAVIDAAQDAANTENTEKVEDVTADNVVPEDKKALKDARADLEKALEDKGSNYTTAEKKVIQDEIQRIEDALEALDNAQDVTEAIKDLPKTVKPDDEDAAEKILDAKEAYNKLTDHEKSLVDETSRKKLDDLVAALTDYDITKGDSGKWTKGSSKGLSFTANGPFSKFVGIEVDGKDVNKKYYEAKSGSTIITLKQSFLKRLSTGKHTITVIYTDGETSGTFKILARSSSPATGDNSNIMLYSATLAVSCAALSVLFFTAKKRKQVN